MQTCLLKTTDDKLTICTHLNHLILDGIIRVRIWSRTGAVKAVVILVVTVIRVAILFVRHEFAFPVAISLASFKLLVAAVAPKVALGVELDQLVTVMAGVRAGQTYTGAATLVLADERGKVKIDKDHKLHYELTGNVIPTSGSP